jgi:hypothetical protein
LRFPDVIAVVLVGATAFGLATAAPRPHKGKVVRVERSRAANAPPRVCEIHTDGSGVCIGAEPGIGDVVMVMNDSGVVAETKITEAAGFATGSNQVCGALWNVKSDLLRGDLTNVTARNFGVVDAEIHPQKGRIVGKEQTIVSPGDPSDTVIVAVDRDGDRTADIIVVQSNCDGLAPGGGGACLDSWARVKGRMVRVQQTNFATCGI